MILRIALFGASGRMGRSIASQIKDAPDLSLTEAIAHASSLSLGELLYGVPISPSLQKDADLFIDFSLSKSLSVSLAIAKKLKKPLVIGVTGLSEEQMAELSAASQKIPIFYSPNFSIGMTLFRRFAREASKFFQSADLFDLHHEAKRDAPSGTALQIAKEMQKTPRIHSIRSGAIIGEHRLLLNSEEERIEMTHSVQNREVFSKGVLAASRFLFRKDPGLYGMEDLLVY